MLTLGRHARDEHVIAPPDENPGFLIGAEGIRGAQVALVTLAGDGHDDGLHLDAGAANPLLPKSTWFAVCAAVFFSLGLARFWWGARLSWQPGWAVRAAVALLAAVAIAANSVCR